MRVNQRATQQIVGRERRERVSQLDSSGDACFDSRRRVNSDVGRLALIMTVRRISVLLVLAAVLNLCVVAVSVNDTLVLRRRNPDGWFNLSVPLNMDKVERYADVDGGFYRSDKLKIDYDYWTFPGTPNWLRGNYATRLLLACSSKHQNRRTWRQSIGGRRAVLQRCSTLDQTNGFRYLYYATFPRVKIFDGDAFHDGMFNITVTYKDSRDSAVAARIVRSIRFVK